MNPFHLAKLTAASLVPLVATLTAASAASPVTGTVHVVENDPGNTAGSLSLNFSAGTPDTVSFFLPGSNKGDYVLDFFATADDFNSGVLASCVAASPWTIELSGPGTTSSNSRLQIDEIDDVALRVRHSYIQREN